MFGVYLEKYKNNKWCGSLGLEKQFEEKDLHNVREYVNEQKQNDSMTRSFVKVAENNGFEIRIDVKRID